MYDNLSVLFGKSFHERIVLLILYFEKIAWVKLPFKMLRKLIVQFGYHCEIHPDSFIDKEAIVTCRLPHPFMIIIHRESVLGHNLCVFQDVTIGVLEKGGERDCPRLGNNVYIGAKASVLGGVKIGDGAKIGAHTLVLGDVLPGQTVIGIHKN